jgi:hypothetical protein
VRAVDVDQALRGLPDSRGSGGDQTMVMIFTICCLVLIAIVWPRAFSLKVQTIRGKPRAKPHRKQPMPRSTRASARRKKSARQTTGRAKRSRPWSCGVEQ